MFRKSIQYLNFNLGIQTKNIERTVLKATSVFHILQKSIKKPPREANMYRIFKEFFLNGKSADSFHVLIKYSIFLNTSFFKTFVQFFIGSLDNLLLKTVIEQWLYLCLNVQPKIQFLIGL